MFTVEESDRCLFVRGYADGSHWTFRSPGCEFGLGVSGQRIWAYGMSGRLSIYDAVNRREVDRFNFKPFDYPTPFGWSVASHDGRCVNLVERIGEKWHTGTAQPVRLRVIDLYDCRIIAEHIIRSELSPANLAARHDGKLVWQWYETNRLVQTLVDPMSGHQDVAVVATTREHDVANYRFLSISPDGRYWVRPDRRQIEVLETAGSGFSSAAEPLYGLGMELWEGFPLRFVRRLPVLQLRESVMIKRLFYKEEDQPAGKALLQQLIRLQAHYNLQPGAELPEEAFASPDSRKQMKDLLYKLYSDLFQGFYWQADSTAFWTYHGGDYICVGVDGSVSPRINSERVRRNQCSPSVWQKLALPGRRLLAEHETGRMILDGTASAQKVYGERMIGIDADHWVAFPRSWHQVQREDAARFVRHENRISVAMGSMADAEIVTAIEKLTRKLTPERQKLERDGELLIRFRLNGEMVPELEFFERLKNPSPAVLSALHRLVAHYAALADKTGQFDFAVGEEGIGLLATAVKTLGVHDHGAMAAICAYGAQVDGEHEYTFAGETLPAIIEAHGWTDQVVALIFAAMDFSFYNTVSDETVWNDWGLKAAVQARDPIATAHMVVSSISNVGRSSVGRGRLAQWAGILRRLGPDPWIDAFADELDAIDARTKVPAQESM